MNLTHISSESIMLCMMLLPSLTHVLISDLIKSSFCCYLTFFSLEQRNALQHKTFRHHLLSCEHRTASHSVNSTSERCHIRVSNYKAQVFALDSLAADEVPAKKKKTVMKN